MSRLPQLYAWLATLTSAFAHLSAAQLRGLAWFSFGMILARSCSVTAVAAQLADFLGQKFDTVKQRLREWYCEADAKAGTHRRQLDVRTCFAPLLGWIRRDWPSRQLALALDATTLGQRFVTLDISVVYRGCAVSVAWRILPALARHPWKEEWLRLLRDLRGQLPPDWTVIVLTDRGLYAKWLFQAIQRQGWHPFMRINTGGSFRPQGEKQRRALATLVPPVGQQWKGVGEAFKDAPKRLRCTLLTRQDAGYADPWLVVTDLAPESAEVCWYGLRAWIEQGFKRLKSGGWDWQNTHMTDPRRAERLWLVLAVSTWWCLRVGGEAEMGLPVETIPPLPEGPRHQAARPSAGGRAAATRPAPEPSPRGRVISVFVRGRMAIVNTLLRAGVLLLGRTLPEPWPTTVPAARTRASPAA
ncbi:MAG TPA: transposase [Gemmataceae bacterium]|nr:transposase [Gemmataceae bacterium]